MTAKWSDLREAVGASPMRRRVIYIEDATWEELRARSRAEGRSMSELIRRALEPAPDDTPAFLKTLDSTIAAVRRQQATRITGHDAFAEVRPAPKPGPKHRKA